MKQIIQNKPILAMIIATVIVISAWATWELTTVPSGGDEMRTNDTRVFNHLLVDYNESIISISGDRLFPFGSSYAICIYINQTSYTAQSNSPLIPLRFLMHLLIANWG